jgi:hypothetical protein
MNTASVGTGPHTLRGPSRPSQTPIYSVMKPGIHLALAR